MRKKSIPYIGVVFIFPFLIGLIIKYWYVVLIVLSGFFVYLLIKKGKQCSSRSQMNEMYINKLIFMMDRGLWRNPRHSVDLLLRHYSPMMDYRKLSHSILRAGTELTKEEKKQVGINPNAKIGKEVFSHFTEAGLPQCVPLATELALAIPMVAGAPEQIKDWSKKGIKRVIFEPAPDCCEICEKLRGEYPTKKAPIPILDTHLGCRCGYTMGSNCFD